MPYLVLDTEATDKYPSTAEVLSVAIIDHLGHVLLDTLVRPVRETRWPAAQRIHGIAPADVLRPEIPTLAELNPRIAEIIASQEVVIYNSQYDATILAEAFALGPPSAVHCCMLTFAEHPEVRSWNDYHGNWRWHSLATAADRVGHVWTGAAHGALSDCYAARDVWAWLTDPAERARLEAAAAEHEEAERIAWHVQDVFGPLEQAETERLAKASRAWQRTYYPRLGITYRSEYHNFTEARESADAFCRHLTGYPLAVWETYGEAWLKLPRYNAADTQIPKHLTTADDVHLLPGAKLPKPKALWVLASDGNRLDAKPLYSRRGLRPGIHFVPFSYGYEPWPEGFCSKTALVRDHKMKPKAADQVAPAYLRVVKHGSRYENEYLLYPIPAPISQPETPALVGTATHGE